MKQNKDATQTIYLQIWPRGKNYNTTMEADFES